jgi:RimJ/RimL family protein N-acetyltransferase
VREGSEGYRFATRREYRETGQVLEDYRLDVQQANLNAYPGLRERLENEGIGFASLAELNPDEALLRRVQYLWAETGDENLELDSLSESFDSWREHVLAGSGQSPETHWLALREGRPVGTTYLKRLSPEAAENDYTAVTPAYRGRGIAQALKLRALAWAQQNGLRYFHTSSDVRNVRMIAINRHLGYQPGVRRMEMARDLQS